MKTVLFDKHLALGAKLVNFAGWEMPVQYQHGIIHEHNKVRNFVGIFDVSHMGRVIIEGNEAESFLDFMSTNKITGKKEGSAIYTVLPNEDGGCIDDAIIYKESRERFFLIVNASNRQKDLEHLQKYAKDYDVFIADRYQEEGILAVQGPQATPLISQIFPQANQMKPMKFILTEFQNQPLILSSTGYTGAGGFEIYATNETIFLLWDELFRLGQIYGIEPIGLGARDTLRLEMGFALYGHELTDEISPIESVSAWTVKMDKPNFLGKEPILKLEKSSTKRSEYGIVMQEKGIPREGYLVFQNEKEIGYVTSGTHSPTLEKGIGIIIVNKPLQVGEIVEIQIRKSRVRAKICKFPLIEGIS